MTDSENLYGPDAMIDSVGKFRLVHLDAPDPATREKRAAMIRDGSYFVDDCPICQEQKAAGGDIVFEPDAEKQA